MKLIDTHCHLNFADFENDREEVISRAKSAGVEKMISIGCRVEDAKKTIEIVEQYENVFAAVGIHPADIDTNFEADFDIIATLAIHPKVVALGETGLDFFRPENPAKEIQLESLRRHFELAKKLEKPVIIHSRAASEEILEALKSFPGQPFVLHCFSEDMAFAEKIFALGGMISFTGIVTYPKNLEVREVAKNVPLEKIMVETDSPFLAPIPFRGKRCEPAFVRNTAEFIANLRGISLEEFAEVTTRNAEVFFRI